jgi:hypothetical protein
MHCVEKHKKSSMSLERGHKNETEPSILTFTSEFAHLSSSLRAVVMHGHKTARVSKDQPNCIGLLVLLC